MFYRGAKRLVSEVVFCPDIQVGLFYNNIEGNQVGVFNPEAVEHLEI